MPKHKKGLGWPAGFHNTEVRRFLEFVEQHVEWGERAYKKGACEEAFNELLTAEEYVGRVNEHVAAASPKTLDAEPRSVNDQTLYDTLWARKNDLYRAVLRQCLRKKRKRASR
jgi:hypothetical protein